MVGRQKDFKKQKYEEQILQALSMYLRRGLSDDRLQHASFTKVELTHDFSFASVYWDCFDPSHKQVITEGLEAALPKVKSYLAGTLTVRQIPQIKFIYDAQYEEEQKITDLLKSERDKGRNF